MVKGGLGETATKRDLEALATNREVRAGFQAVADSLDLIRADLREVKVVLPPLVRSVGSLEAEVHDLRGRVTRLERKAGLAK